MALPAFNMRQLLEAGVSLRPPVASLEPQDGALHLRRPQQHPHHRPDADRRRCCIRRWSRSPTPSPAAAACCSSAPSARPRMRSPTPPSARAQYFINHRWLGGTLTNWKTISQSIRRLRQLDDILADPQGRTKKEILHAHARARQAQPVAGRHQGHGRPARPAVRDRHEQGEHRHPGSHASSASRSSPSSTPTAIPTASTSRSRATTTPAAPSRSIATSSRAPPSTASSAARSRPASTSAPPRRRRPRSCRRPRPSSRASKRRAARPTT